MKKCKPDVVIVVAICINQYTLHWHFFDTPAMPTVSFLLLQHWRRCWPRLALGGGLLLALLLSCGWVIGQAPVVQALDVLLMQAIHRQPLPGANQVSIALQWLGSLPVMAGLVLVAAAVLLRRRQVQKAAQLLLTLGGSVLLIWTVKLVIARPRPQLWPTDVVSFGDSFPSGHSLYAAALSVALALLWRGPGRVWAWTLAALWTLLMGASRVHLGVHFPSDVLAGWVAGVGWAIAVWRFFRWQPPV